MFSSNLKWGFLGILFLCIAQLYGDSPSNPGKGWLPVNVEIKGPLSVSEDSVALLSIAIQPTKKLQDIHYSIHFDPMLRVLDVKDLEGFIDGEQGLEKTIRFTPKRHGVFTVTCFVSGRMDGQKLIRSSSITVQVKKKDGPEKLNGPDPKKESVSPGRTQVHSR